MSDIETAGKEAADSIIEHYGIKGMKWGVRRTEKQLARARKGKELSEDAAEADKAQAKASTEGVQALSNAELKSLTTRINLEKSYESLTTGDTGESTVVKGAKWAHKNILVQVGLRAAQEVGKNRLAKEMQKALDEKTKKSD